MAKMKRIYIWLREVKHKPEKEIVEMAKSVFDLNDTTWLRRQIAHVKKTYGTKKEV